ncbi:MAG: phage DNA encapsidation protein [Erysipelotrichia bacterium]|nr:phage DNA encapsidation protein [Erysipelotrichia bacterium]
MTEHNSIVESVFLDWSPIWGMFNGQYYKFLAIIGGRGIGKTYGAWEYIARQYKKNKWSILEKFMWLRTTDKAIQGLKAQSGLKLCDQGVQHKYNIKVYVVGNNIYIRDMPTNGTIPLGEDWEDWKKKHPGTHVGYLLPVSTFYEVKGTEWNDVKIIFFDEVNRERGERKTFDLAYAFINQIESIARLRQDLRVVMMGNTIDDTSEILGQLNFIPRKFGIFRLRGKRTIVMYLRDSNAFKEKRAESLAYIFSNRGQVSSLDNETANKELFSPKVKYISQFPNNKFMYRIYFTHSNYFDLYSVKDGYWIGVTRIHPGVHQMFSFNPDLDGVIRYDRDRVIMLKKFYHMKHFHYQSEPIAAKFKAALETVISLK